MYAIAFGLGHIKMICVSMIRGGMLRGRECDILLIHVLLCVTAHLLIPVPGMVCVSRLYWGAVGAEAPDWLVPTTND